jgi:hypothetical protein
MGEKGEISYSLEDIGKSLLQSPYTIFSDNISGSCQKTILSVRVK